MAKHVITYACGCSGEITLLGPAAAHNRHIEWYETQGICPDCWERSLQGTNEEAAKESAPVKAETV